MISRTIEIGDLFETLGKVDMTDCFGSKGRYSNWENNVATPALKILGYEVINWYSTDSDSFGPLVRAVKVKKDGVEKVLEYG